MKPLLNSNNGADITIYPGGPPLTEVVSVGGQRKKGL